MTFRDSVSQERRELPFGESGYLHVPLRIAERHLTEDTQSSSSVVQGIGTHIQIYIESERDSMLIMVPVSEWIMTDLYSRSLSGWSINLKRWFSAIEHSEGTVEVIIYILDSIPM